MRSLRPLFLLILLSGTGFLHAQWVRTNGPYSDNVTCFAAGEDARGALSVYAGTANWVHRSTNNGKTWDAMTTGFTDPHVYSLAICPGATGETEMFAGTYNGGVCLSTNGGATWKPVNDGLKEGVTGVRVAACRTAAGTMVFAGTSNAGVFSSSNSGKSWLSANQGLGDTVVNTLVTGEIHDGTVDVYAGTTKGVFVSTDGGTTWKPINAGLPGVYINALAFSSNPFEPGRSVLFVAAAMQSGSAVFRSTDGGTNWSPAGAGLSNTNVMTLTMSGKTIFAGTSSGVYRSTDNGQSWTSFSTGLTYTYVGALIVTPSTAATGAANVFAGTFFGGVWRRPLADLATSMRATGDAAPAGFGLEQNYPNPFNPSTNIKFQIPPAGGGPDPNRVLLRVYSTLGQEVATLVNEVKAPGTYEVRFDGSKLASGVYFYRLQAGNMTDVKRLTILK